MSDLTRTVHLTEIPAREVRWAAVMALLLAMALASLIMAVGLFELLHADRIYPGLTVLDSDIGGLTLRQAVAHLEARFDHAPPELVTLRYGPQVWEVRASELGVRLDAPATAALAYTVGRGDTPLADLLRQGRLLWEGQTIAPLLRLDRGKAALYVSRLARQIERPARNAMLTIEGLEVRETPAQIGRQVDVAATVDRLEARLTGHSGGEVELVVRDVAPAIGDAAAARAQVATMIGAPLWLSFTERTWVYQDGLHLRTAERTWLLDQATIASLIGLRQEKGEDGVVRWVPYLEREKLAPYLAPIAAQINQASRDARLDFDPQTGRLTPIVTSQEGRTLDVAEAVRLVEAQVTTEQRVVALPVQIEKPRVAMEDAGTMGIVELVSRGESWFKGSSWGRMQNIKTAAAQFQGVVVPPGEVFSFNRYLGSVTDAEGYEDSYIIFGDRTVLGPGGGVCQVSTTAFRAAFWGGFPIVERWAHTYRVGWYEPPVGLDATVFSPWVDFKFQNDTLHYLLVETEVDTKNGLLAFNFYGTRPDRTVEMEGPFQANRVPHGPPVYEKDPTLPQGTVKQVDWPHDGLDVTIYRIIKRGELVVERKRFFSHYQPWVARYLVGAAMD